MQVVSAREMALLQSSGRLQAGVISAINCWIGKRRDSQPVLLMEN